MKLRCEPVSSGKYSIHNPSLGSTKCTARSLFSSAQVTYTRSLPKVIPQGFQGRLKSRIGVQLMRSTSCTRSRYRPTRNRRSSRVPESSDPAKKMRSSAVIAFKVVPGSVRQYAYSRRILHPNRRLRERDKAKLAIQLLRSARCQDPTPQTLQLWMRQHSC